MRAGWVVRRVGALALVVPLSCPAAAQETTSELRVLSGPGAASIVTLRAAPAAVIEDRTPGAKPAAAGQGPVSTGETFTGELTLFLRGAPITRPAAIEVGDALVSMVRLFPEAGGTAVTVFVRQPVTYTVGRPSPLGEIRVELHGRTRALVAQPGAQPGRLKFVRPAESGAQEVAVDADSLSYDQQANTLTARGGVTLTRGDTTLTADEVIYDRTKSVAEARGHVVITDPQAYIEGDVARLDLEAETGWIDGATANLRPSNYTLTAGHLEKKGGPCYSVANGIFTTCECGGLERPSWSIAGQQTNVELEGTGVARGVTFRVKDTPVFYLPYFLFPANTQRQTGFLLPRVGISNTRGFQYEQPFYWAINKSSDATVALDVETAARLGLIGEYRYVLSRHARGQFAGAYYNEHIGGIDKGVTQADGTPEELNENRFGFTGRHVSPFYGKSKFYLDVFAVSDDSFLRDMNTFNFSARQDYSLRSTRFTTSRTGVLKTWRSGLAQIETAWNQDLVDPDELVPQKLPRIEVEHGMPLLGERVIGRVNAQAIDFQREDGYDGLRGYLAPELFLPFRLGRFFSGSVTGRVSETAYHLTDDEQVARVIPNNSAKAVAKGFERFQTFGNDLPGLPPLDRNNTREIGEVQAGARTGIERVFDFHHFGFERLKHTIEPEVQYLYVPQVGRPIFDNVPLPDCKAIFPASARRRGINCGASLFSEGYLFDERDAIDRRNFLSYGLTTRLLARTPSAAEGTPEPAEPQRPRSGEGAEPEALPQGLPASIVPTPGEASAERAGTQPRELLRASILQGYDISRALVGNSHLSDIDLGLHLSPSDYLGLAYNTTVNVEQSTVRGITFGAVLREPWWKPPASGPGLQSPSSIGVSYRFIEKGVNEDVSNEETTASTQSSLDKLLAGSGVNELDGSVYLRLGDYLGFTFLSRYNFAHSTERDEQGRAQDVGPHFLERDYLLRIISRCNCWVLEAGFANKTNPDENVARVQVTLLGLGSFGKTPTGRNYVGFTPLQQLSLPPRPGGGAAWRQGYRQ